MQSTVTFEISFKSAVVKTQSFGVVSLLASHRARKLRAVGTLPAAPPLNKDRLYTVSQWKIGIFEFLGLGRSRYGLILGCAASWSKQFLSHGIH